MSNIAVDIVHLVLDGVAAELAHGPYLGHMIERELQRLLEQQGLPPGCVGGDSRQSIALPLSLPTHASAGQIASETATALYQALGAPPGARLMHSL